MTMGLLKMRLPKALNTLAESFKEISHNCLQYEWYPHSSVMLHD